MAKKKRVSRQEYRIVTKALPEGVLITDRDGTLLYVNPALEEMFGIPSSISVGTHFRNYITPASAQNAEALFLGCAAGKVVREIELEAVHSDHHVFPIEIAASPILREGKFWGVQTVVRDITRRKAAEEAVRRSEQRFRTMFENAAIGIAHTDMDGRILQVNDRFCEMIGYAREDIIGKTCEEITLADDWEAEHEWLRRLMDGQVTHYAIEKRYVRRDDSLVWVHLTRSIQRDEEGDPDYFVLFITDISQRKQAEQALQEGEQRFRAVLENSLDVAYRRDLPNNRYDYISPVVEQTIGFSPEEMSEFSDDDLFAHIHPDDADRVWREYDAAMEAGSGAIEYRFQCRDGTYLWLADYFVVQKDEAGRPLYMSGSMRNITGLKQTEGALRNSEQRFRKLFEADLMGVFITKPDGTFLDCNDTMVRMLGYDSREEVLQHRSSDFYVDQEFRREAVEILHKEGIYLSKEGRVWRKDGSIAYLLGAAVLLQDEQTGEPYVQGVAIDITERKHAEEALRASEQRYRRLFEANLAGVYLTKPDGTIIDFNDAMMRMLGYDSREELLCLRSTDLYADPEFRKELIYLLQRDGIVPAREAVLLRKDGSVLHALGHAVLLMDEQTGERYIQGMAIDITKRKQVEEALLELTHTLESKVAQRTAELQRRTRQLQEMTLELLDAEDRERRRLAEILHDDLQQELAAVKFQVQLVRRQTRDDASLQATVAQADHMLKDAIDKSRSLSHELSPAVMHHDDFAETLRWLASEMQARHGLTVHVLAAGEVRVESEATKSLLYRAAQELLFNVVKHGQIKEARLRVRQCRRCVCLSVSDRGRGFDPQELEEAGGFGLLSMRQRVELLKGRMKIQSAPGRGSRFSIVVPAGTEDVTKPQEEERRKGVSPAIRPPVPPAAVPLSHRLRVLVADDHEIVREGLISLLREEHTVDVVGEATNGREAVELANRLEPDVVVMDVSMPLMNGDEATRQIKQHRPDTRVVALSMHDEPETAERMYSAGAEAYVPKAAPSEDLLAALRGPQADA